MIEYLEIANLPRDELLEEYCKLIDRFKDLRESNETDTQKIYELKRSLDTAIATQAYLSQELEQYTSSDNNKTEKELDKVQGELVEVKKKYENLKFSFDSLQQDYSLLAEENSKISINLQDTLKRKEQVPSEVDSKILDDYLLRIQVLENENMDLLQKIEDFEERSVRYTLTIAECEKNIEILRDQIVCLEENLKFKRNDLEEKLQILESTQEQLAEANAKIVMLSSAPDNNDRKGNSLFAEVDDQRQAMKQLLTAQKKSYMHMKKIYNESEHEIRRLKRENISMHTELEACSTIFCNADKIYQEKLNERIRHLLNQNEDLERKLKWTQKRLKELADDRGVLFLDSMLSFCKKETDDLKSQLHSVRIQKASLEEQLRNAQQDTARWRFESLKSRCILIDREHLLTENNVAFKPIHALEYNISEKEQEEAKPRIVTNRRSNTFENLNERTPISSSTIQINQEIVSPQQNSSKDISISSTTSIKKEEEDKEQVNISVDLTAVSCKNEDITEDCTELKKMSKIPKNNHHSADGDKENNNTINSVDDFPIVNKFTKLGLNPPSPMRPSQRSLEKQTPKKSSSCARSILTKQNDLLFKDSSKSVKFSSNGDIVHNLTPNRPSPPTSVTEDTCTTGNVESNSSVKQLRTKSNIVVRRIFLSSKHD